ncbi:hypothetical protein B0H14DRAFT_2584010 [Mycena olivaceomarginata]|nr:hypothetical protein B0H14DRAFT_2584010 [Mycena olivaceomarginata]
MSGRQIHQGVAFVALRMGGATGFPPLLRDQLSSREAHHRLRVVMAPFVATMKGVILETSARKERRRTWDIISVVVRRRGGREEGGHRSCYQAIFGTLLTTSIAILEGERTAQSSQFPTIFGQTIACEVFLQPAFSEILAGTGPKKFASQGCQGAWQLEFVCQESAS